MLNSILTSKNLKLSVKLTIKAAISVALVALSVGLPQLVHLIAGAQGGATWLPMYLPVLIGGCLLGTWWGLGIGITAPIVSFLITFAAGNPMPALARLPYMVAELAAFAAISGAFSNKISKNKWLAFPAVLSAQVGGRVVFIVLAAIFGSVSPITLSLAWHQVQAGFVGLIVQAIIVPCIIILLSVLLQKEKDSE